MMQTGEPATRSWGHVATILELDSRLPRQVFRSNFAQFCWLEFEDVLGAPFFDCLKVLSSHYANRKILVGCVSPEPAANFGHSGIAAFNAVDSVEHYDAFMDAGLIDNRITIRNVGDVIAFVADNGEWAFVADRTAEVAVGVQEEARGWPLVAGIRYHTFGTMLDIASGPYRGVLPDASRDLYQRNYGERSWHVSESGEG